MIATATLTLYPALFGLLALFGFVWVCTRTKQTFQLFAIVVFVVFVLTILASNALLVVNMGTEVVKHCKSQWDAGSHSCQIDIAPKY